MLWATGDLARWPGGEGAAALCRKVAEAPEGGAIEVWGDGSAVRSFIYVEDLVEGVVTLVRSACEEPTNIGTREYLSVDELVATVIDVSGKDLSATHVEGPVGVTSRNFSNDQIESLGFSPKIALRRGMS